MPAPERKVSSHSLEDHPEYVSAIGMVSLEAIALELRLALLLARTLTIPTRTAQAIYLTPKAEGTRMDIFQNVAHAALAVPASRKNSELGKQKTQALKDVLRIIKRARALITKRHRVIHDEWNYSDKEKTVTRRLIDGRVGRISVPTPTGGLKDMLYEIRALIDDTYDLSERFREHPPTMANLRRSAAKSG